MADVLSILDKIPLFDTGFIALVALVLALTRTTSGMTDNEKKDYEQMKVRVNELEKIILQKKSSQNGEN